jgi:hypothetical protein
MMSIKAIESFLVGFVLAASLVACGASSVQGDGEIVTETRSLEDFSSLRVSNGATAVFTVDEAATGEVVVAVTTDSNLLEYVETGVSDETLTVSVESGREVSATRGYTVEGTMATVRRVEATDAGEATITASVSAVELKADDAGRINGRALEAGDVDVDADNGAQITVCATGTVTGMVNNGADLVVLCGGNVGAVETSNGGTVSTS